MKTMEDKHTPVQWFAFQLGITSGTLLEKAVEIEKDHMYQLFDAGVSATEDHHKDFEQYYKGNYETEDRNETTDRADPR